MGYSSDSSGARVPLPLRSSAYCAEVEFAAALLESAGELALEFFGKKIDVEEKSDGSPVTQADLKIERLLRESVQGRYPDNGILGEEEAELAATESASGSASLRRWIIDPIDGTFNFARGIPIFSTLIALEEDGEIVVGGVHNPALNELYLAAKGGGACKNGESISVSQVSEIDSSLFTFGAPDRIRNCGLWDAFARTVDDTYRQRGYGDYLGFAMVFEGMGEAHLEVGVKPWDLAAMKVIVEEAGGVFHDLRGGSSIWYGDGLITNARLSDEFSRRFRLDNDS